MKKSNIQPLVSVIIPVYNVREFLERAVDSVLKQTYRNLEIILVDDGSNDGSGELCDEIAVRDDRIIVIHQKNQGLSGARNTGIKNSHGAFLTFVDSDDESSPDLVETLLNLTQQHQTKMSICSFAEAWPDGKRRNFATQRDNQVFVTADCLTEMLLEHGFTLMACGKIYARELFDNVEFPLGKLYEDVGTTYRLMLQCDKIPVDYSAKYLYYQNSASIIHQKFTQRNLDLIELTDKMCVDIADYYGDQIFTQLNDALKLRRMHARFSVLRLIGKNREHETTRQTTITYLREHRDDVLKNPLSSKRDQLAMRSLLISPGFFNLAWLVYAKIRK